MPFNQQLTLGFVDRPGSRRSAIVVLGRAPSRQEPASRAATPMRWFDFTLLGIEALSGAIGSIAPASSWLSK